MTRKIRESLGLTIIVLLTSACGPKGPVTDGTCGGVSTPLETTEKDASGSKVAVKLYVMSQCPYAKQVIESLAQIGKSLAEHIDASIDFIGTTADAKSKCLHGESECQGNTVLLCVDEYATGAMVHMAACMMRDMKDIPGNWRGCAEETGIDPVPIGECVGSDEGHRLLGESMDRSVAAQATGSPTIIIGGKQYKGPRTPEGLLSAICMAMPEADRPPQCPEITEVRLTVISDERCDDCKARAENMVENFESIFHGMQIQWLDWSDPAAQDLASDVGVGLLPAYIFENSVEESFMYSKIENHVFATGKYLVLDPEKIKADFDPLAEICDNGIDDDANGSIDCADDGCAVTLECRSEVAGMLELFVMSHCPYGNKAEAELPAVLAVVGSEIDLQLHFIVDVLDADGYAEYKNKNWCHEYAPGTWVCSMHGKEETDENLRQICIQDIANDPSKLAAYIACRNANPSSATWSSCATASGLDIHAISSCAQGPKGLELMAADAALCDGLDIHGCPTFLWNAVRIDRPEYKAQSIIEMFCNYNPGATSCAGI